MSITILHVNILKDTYSNSDKTWWELSKTNSTHL